MPQEIWGIGGFPQEVWGVNGKKTGIQPAKMRTEDQAQGLIPSEYFPDGEATSHEPSSNGGRVFSFIPYEFFDHVVWPMEHLYNCQSLAILDISIMSTAL